MPVTTTGFVGVFLGRHLPGVEADDAIGGTQDNLLPHYRGQCFGERELLGETVRIVFGIAMGESREAANGVSGDNPDVVARGDRGLD